MEKKLVLVPGKGRKGKIKPADQGRISKPIPPPNFLGEYGREIWNRYLPDMLERRTLSRTDVHNFEIFCMTYHNWRVAALALQKGGVVLINKAGNSIKNPAATVVNEQLRLMAAYSAMLGLTPASRRSYADSDRDQDLNPFSDL